MHINEKHLLQILQAFYYIIAFINDIIGTNEVAPTKTPAIRRIKVKLILIFLHYNLHDSPLFLGTVFRCLSNLATSIIIKATTFGPVSLGGEIQEVTVYFTS